MKRILAALLNVIVGFLGIVCIILAAIVIFAVYLSFYGLMIAIPVFFVLLLLRWFGII